MATNLVENIRALHERRVYFNYIFSGNHHTMISDIVNEIFVESQNCVLNVHILDNHLDSLQFIKKNLELQSIDAQQSPKFIVIHQHNETLSDNLVNFIEHNLTKQNVRFIFLSSNQHVVPHSIRKKTIHLMIASPQKNTVESETAVTSSCRELAHAAIQEHALAQLQNEIPREIYDELLRT